MTRVTLTLVSETGEPITEGSATPGPGPARPGPAEPPALHPGFSDVSHLDHHRAPTSDNTAEPSRTLQRQLEHILGGAPTMTVAELAERAGVSEEFARMFWKAMGFPSPPSGEPCYVDADADALAAVGEVVERGIIDTYTAISLLRAQSHTTDRLVLWQTEAMVEHVARSLQLDDTSARLVVLDHAELMVDLLVEQVGYAWRRQLAALLSRMDAEVSQSRQANDAPWIMPLIRGIGFVDMVAYTRRSAELGTHALADLIQTFEFTARDVVTAAGARVVKTIGDAVLFVADELEVAVDVTMDLVQALAAKENMLPVRAGVVWGGVLSRSGDVFGPTVNLASRLADVAPAGTVLTDVATAEELFRSPAGRRYAMVRRADAELQGMGMISPIELRRLAT